MNTVWNPGCKRGGGGTVTLDQQGFSMIFGTLPVNTRHAQAPSEITPRWVLRQVGMTWVLWWVAGRTTLPLLCFVTEVASTASQGMPDAYLTPATRMKQRKWPESTLKGVIDLGLLYSSGSHPGRHTSGMSHLMYEHRCYLILRHPRYTFGIQSFQERDGCGDIEDE
jgi:hypothetical protein